MLRQLRALGALGAAITFLTRLPWPLAPREGWTPEDLARGTLYFPIVGVIVGAWGGLLYWVATLWWPASVAVVLSTMGTVWLTGGLHEDGLADAADGFGGGRDRAHILAIMKDSHIGAYGALALLLVVGAKLAALAALSRTDVVRALIVGHTLGRWSSLPLLWGAPYVRETGGTGAAFVGSVPLPRLVMASLLAALIVAAALGTRVAPPAAAALGVTVVAGLYFVRRVGGITGDCLGATNQCVELAAYLAIVAMR